jgi:hypothetical protein
MEKLRLFAGLTTAHIKRLKSYLPQLIGAVVILLVICLSLAAFVARKIFSEKTFTTVNVGYYLPEDDDMKYNSMALSMMEDMDSMSEVASLVRVSDTAEGYSLLEKGDLLFFIIVPEKFFTGIMNGTNPRLTIAIQNYDSITTYIANELLLSYARYLGVAQAGIYSGLDTIRESDGSAEEENTVLNNTNIIYLERALNHDSYLDTVDAKDAGDFTLSMRYIAAAVIITLMFSGFILSSWLKGTGSGVTRSMNARGINSFLCYLCEFISCIPAVYITFIPCLVVVCIYNGQAKPSTLFTIIPVIIVAAFFISLVCHLCSSLFSANLIIFFITMLLMYIGGGLVPSSFLPGVIQSLSQYLPGEYLISYVAGCLF